MKRILLSLVALFAIATSSFAQKQYVTISVYIKLDHSKAVAYLTGCVPSDMTCWYDEIFDIAGTGINTPAWLLTELSKNGFSLEKTTSCCSSYYEIDRYVLSKDTSSPSTSSAKIATVNTDDTTEVKEIARYNLQGIPVKESDKGLQIIVYSNYTTKTVLVE